MTSFCGKTTCSAAFYSTRHVGTKIWVEKAKIQILADLYCNSTISAGDAGQVFWYFVQRQKDVNCKFWLRICATVCPHNGLPKIDTGVNN